MTSALWTHIDAAKATGGKAVGDWSVRGLSIDSRSIAPGEMFIPLKDARDGHDFIPSARGNGAGAILSERKDEAAPALIVDDAMGALRALAHAAAQRSKAKRIGVTGSVGKTSVKEALAHMLSEFGLTHKSIKSFNNHWGVPLTLAGMAAETDFGVFEMGMNHAGEMRDLSQIVQPDLAVITTVAGAHLAHFDSVDAIADAKAEIIDGVVEGGTLILNADNDYTPRIAEAARARGLSVITFGHAGADVQIIQSDIQANGFTTTFKINGQETPVTMSQAGAHWVSNAACCMAVASVLKLDLNRAAKTLESFGALAGRGERHSVKIDDKSITLIDDSYNANPTSMRAAISVLGAQKGGKIAVLGDMYELGADELELHAGLAAPLIEAKIDRVIVCGETMRSLRGALPQAMRGAWTPDWDVALAALKNDIEDGDTVLVKGSNGVGLSKLVSALLAQSATEGE